MKSSCTACTQATLVGAKVWVFGGEDAARRPLDDVHVLDLADMSWATPELSGRSPSRRSAHTAVAFDDRWLLVFGGGSLVRIHRISFRHHMLSHHCQ
jgi:N-acetylneuraminic acid mutarotase